MISPCRLRLLSVGCALASSSTWPTRLVAQAPEALLPTLTLEQKAGQLFMAWTLSRPDGEGERQNHARLLRAVQDVGLGGVILSLGTVDDAATLVPRLQAAAAIPLLVAGDFEGGVWFRLRGATELGNQMLVGATGSSALAEAMGRITGDEAKALGCHWVFGPVLDVNSNAANPIINVRSFGEDPALVARLGSAFARGVRGAGLLPCGKHFPGHGDVASDSHLALPTVPGDAARLHAVELRPFAAAAAEGLESVMTGHLAVPGLGEAPDVPATLSHHILGDVLRGELGFTGLVVTDALDMGGVKNKLAPGEVAVRALLAGADVLLMPPDPLAARAAVVAAVQGGRVPTARLDDAVLRILRMKQRVGLFDGGGRIAADWRQRLATPASEAVADAIAQRGLTLVRDDEGLVPLHGDKALLVTLLDEPGGGFDGGDEGAPGRAFAKALGDGIGDEVVLTGKSHADEVEAAVAKVAAARRVVVALFVKVRSYAGTIGLPPALQPVVAALQREQDVVAVSFGNPYLAQRMPAVDAYLCAYVATSRTEQAAAAALRGERALVGRLPVGIPEFAPAGGGQSLYPGSAVPAGDLAAADLDAALPEQLRATLAAAVADHAFPGAVCVVARHGQKVLELAVGKLGYEADDAAVTPGTRYDLASLTKVCATTPAVLRLAAAGKLSLDDPVQKWLPAFTGIGKERVTLRHLLAHCGGLPAYERYYRTLHGRDAIVAAAAAEGLMTEPGTGSTYSDLGFILLSAVVEAASGERFADYVAREVWQPLGMAHAQWAPTDGPACDAAPTESDDGRGGIVRGYVHDENAFAMGGVSGHAGMFATADDVLRIGAMLLGGGRGFLPRAQVLTATHPAGIVAGDTSRAVGLQMLQRDSYAGSEVSPGAFGHTGFTGTSLWCDPRLDLCVVLLTNRVHPTRVNNKIQGVRRAVHDLVRGAVR